MQLGCHPGKPSIAHKSKAIPCLTIQPIQLLYQHAHLKHTYNNTYLFMHCEFPMGSNPTQHYMYSTLHVLMISYGHLYVMVCGQSHSASHCFFSCNQAWMQLGCHPRKPSIAHKSKAIPYLTIQPIQLLYQHAHLNHTGFLVTHFLHVEFPMVPKPTQHYMCPWYHMDTWMSWFVALAKAIHHPTVFFLQPSLNAVGVPHSKIEA